MPNLQVAVDREPPDVVRALRECARFVLVPRVVVESRVQRGSDRREVRAPVSAAVRSGQQVQAAEPRLRGRHCPDRPGREPEVPEIGSNMHIVVAIGPHAVGCEADVGVGSEKSRVLQAREVLEEIVALRLRQRIRSRDPARASSEARRDTRVRSGRGRRRQRASRRRGRRSSRRWQRTTRIDCPSGAGSPRSPAPTRGRRSDSFDGNSPVAYSMLPRLESNEPRSSCTSPPLRTGEAHGFHGQRARIGRDAVRAGADAALQLDRAEAVREVRKVREIDEVIFGVVQRNPVERDVDAALIDAAEPHVRVAGERAGIGVRRDRRRRGEQQRKLLAEVPPLELGLIDACAGTGAAASPRTAVIVAASSVRGVGVRRTCSVVSPAAARTSTAANPARTNRRRVVPEICEPETTVGVGARGVVPPMAVTVTPASG